MASMLAIAAMNITAPLFYAGSVLCTVILRSRQQAHAATYTVSQQHTGNSSAISSMKIIQRT
jgi:hypothetical protein